MKRICEKCGKEINNDKAKFCPNCGESLGLLVDTIEVPNKADESLVETTASREEEIKISDNLENNGEEISTPDHLENYEKEKNIPCNAISEEAERAERIAHREEERYNSEQKAQLSLISHSAQVLFILTFVGLILDFFYGIGSLMCIPVAIVASVKARKAYLIEKRVPTKLIWSMVIGYLGGIFGFLFLIFML